MRIYCMEGNTMMDEQWDKIKYFKREEFVSPDTNTEYMDFRLVEYLDAMRQILNMPLVINSGYRSVPHNIKVGGNLNSRHLTGIAVDIACWSDKTRGKIIDFAVRYDAGIRIMGLGLAKGFVHLDIDISRGEFTSWVY